jgi:hypothetical protein
MAGAGGARGGNRLGLFMNNPAHRADASVSSSVHHSSFIIHHFPTRFGHLAKSGCLSRHYY